jgi:hypothetical protein
MYNKTIGQNSQESVALFNTMDNVASLLSQIMLMRIRLWVVQHLKNINWPNWNQPKYSSTVKFPCINMSHCFLESHLVRIKWRISLVGATLYQMTLDQITIGQNSQGSVASFNSEDDLFSLFSQITFSENNLKTGCVWCDALKPSLDQMTIIQGSVPSFNSQDDLASLFSRITFGENNLKTQLGWCITLSNGTWPNNNWPK